MPELQGHREVCRVKPVRTLLKMRSDRNPASLTKCRSRDDITHLNPLWKTRPGIAYEVFRACAALHPRSDFNGVCLRPVSDFNGKKTPDILRDDDVMSPAVGSYRQPCKLI